MTDIIGFVGYESEDIILYLAYCLSVCGKRVAIEDRTEHSILLRMLEADCKEGKGEQEEVFYQGFYVTNAITQREDYDIILLLFGYRLRHPKLYECSKLVMVTDALPAHARLLKEIEPWERRQLLIIRDCFESKHGEKYLEFLTRQKVEGVIFIPRTERDVRIRNSLGTAEHIRIERLSAEMKKLIGQIMELIYPDGLGYFRKKIRKGNR